MISFAENKYIVYSSYFIMTLSVVAIIIGSFFNVINCDSAIILTEMERISEGYVPYKTMHLNYPPMWFYINVLLKWIFEVPYGEYHFYLGVHWLFAIGCALCIYLISNSINNNRFISILSVWLFFIMSHWLDGNSVLFEIPSIFWGLLSIVLAIRFVDKSDWYYLLVGVFACCSFLTKQFGLGFLLLTLWLIVVSDTQNKGKKTCLYILGYIIPLIICFLFWGQSVFQSILFNGYGIDTMILYQGNEAPFICKIQRVFDNLLHFCNRIAPICYFSVLILPVIIKEKKWKEACLCWFAIGGFMFQFWFVGGGNHYYLYAVPFSVLLIPVILSLNLSVTFKYIGCAFVGITVLFNSWSTFNNRLWKVYMHNGQKSLIAQINTGKTVSEIVGAGTVFIPHGGIVYLYYTGNLRSKNMAEFGYANGPMEIDINMATMQVHSVDYVIHFTEKLMRELYPSGNDYEYFYTDSLKKYVNTFPSDTLGTEIVIHRMIHN